MAVTIDAAPDQVWPWLVQLGGDPGGQVWGAPKSHEQREVPIPRFLIDDIAEHIRGKKPDELVFTGVRGGGALRAAVFRRAGFDKAAEAIGVAGLHPHELRHTAASLAIASGANVKLAQLMLGHKSATVTLDQYGHLFGDDLDTIADRLDACAQEALGARPHRRHATAEVVSLPTPDSQPARCPRKCGLLCTGDHSADFNTGPNWARAGAVSRTSCGLLRTICGLKVI